MSRAATCRVLGAQMVYSPNQLKDEYDILDTSSWTLERFPSRSLV